MKKIFLTLFFCMASLQIAAAAVYLEGFGGYTTIADAENMYGFGGGAGIQVTDNINFLIRSFSGSKTVNPNDLDEEHYSFMMVTGTVEYYYALQKAPVAFSGFLSFGYSETEMEKAFFPPVSDKGACASLGAGAYFILTQHISPFLIISYHKSFYSEELKNKSIAGLQILLGVRGTIFGKNRSIAEGY